MKIFKDINLLGGPTPKFKNPAVTVGIFDGVHRGHQELILKLNEIAQENHGESVVVTFDPFPVKYFQPDIEIIELTTLEDKLALLEKFDVDNVIVIPFDKDFSEMSAETYIEEFLVKKVHAHTLLVGRDHVFGHKRSGNYAMLEKYAENGSFTLTEANQIGDLDGTISSTRIRACMMLGQKEKARELLGH